MRERKYVKFRVDMFDDTKFKIIDMKPERDLIHYVWTRLVILAGKVNLEGDLYLSKNIPYTIETLSIEFNRSIDQIKLALDVLIELEMIEFSENKIYRVKNFAKHQNIKVNDKIKYKVNENDKNNDKTTKNKEVSEIESEKCNIIDNKDNKTENKTNLNKLQTEVNTNIKNYTVNNLGTNYIDDDSGKPHNNVSNIKHKSNSSNNTDSHNDIPITLQRKKTKKSNKNSNINNLINIIDEDSEDNLLCFFSDEVEERSLAEGEQVIGEWSF
ncbi:phage replisome organizer N-terminal domain-containing protein [Clostridium saccharobutylicum]|uniref:Putative phage replisome organizer n=1 Tax=Clostridium saccharobutylicum DSM 13864 TaxID=1345695 RepID=U5MXB0_CLOSA|nr:phage replisome organizer N-terminal domain-containing protein [Clostridium saccharobutylicum]AGX45183.1 putative phage replisome organizer [Clostridium saccharobutylicum DSM 13864]AQR92461.1 hypothetical protein CLOSC_41910 [Clostridium saccharobutylicum]AQS02364.1 hypothetical protein CSACC_41970 [Clostridium saccharobutylicum]AQS11968.1 hypothetical protein CLOBY_41260 [Clostridium saccharobutylicum]AQS16347.1 hypothetical protein CLOSACC_41970 [Clostridium saccharobutylicum]